MLDRPRIRELTERESAALDERTPGSAELFRRAGRVLPGGVSSSFQLRRPWPIYLERGEGPRVWDVDGNEYLDFHNGFSSMLQGHAHPAIGAAVAARYARGTHFAAPTEDAVVVAEELARRFGLPRWRYTNSGTESTMGAIRLARAADRAQRRREDPRLLPRPPRRGDGRPQRRHPAVHGGGGPLRRVQRRARDGAADRRAGRRGAQAGLRDHGGGDDERRARPPRGRLPGGRARSHAQTRGSS